MYSVPQEDHPQDSALAVHPWVSGFRIEGFRGSGAGGLGFVGRVFSSYGFSVSIVDHASCAQCFMGQKSLVRSFRQ